MTVAIRIHKLGKRYQISHQREGQYTMLREVLAHQVRALGQRLRHPLSPNREMVDVEEFWALRDVDFEVAQGERVGIIGRNGAGKSTLLKILSRITEPSAGSVEVTGRVASLLEVGTGFHPELTGRENTYLNGALLGMSRATIRARFDEIVAFAEVEKFLDTPVKRYSSGMYVRLAFAIAAHLEPDVLIVDEVLAVGDLAFQRKCIGKMDEVGRQGRTVLFVSHNMQSIRALCQRGVVLDGGRKAFDGPMQEAVDTYRGLLVPGGFGADTAVGDNTLRRGSGAVRYSRIELCDASGRRCARFPSGSAARIELEYSVISDVPELLCAIALRSAGSRDVVTNVRHWLSREPLRAGSTGRATIELNLERVRASEYPLYFWLGDGDKGYYDVVDDVVAPLTVTSNDAAGPKQAGYFDIPSRLIEGEH